MNNIMEAESKQVSTFTNSDKVGLAYALIVLLGVITTEIIASYNHYAVEISHGETKLVLTPHEKSVKESEVLINDEKGASNT